MKKVMIVLAAAIFLGACHCTKCTNTPNRSNTCVKAACACKHHHKAGCKCPKCKQAGCTKKADKSFPSSAKPASKATDDAALASVGKVSKKADVTVLSFNEPINFAHNSDKIESASVAPIKKAADILKKYPDASVRVAGYTDSLGNPDYNVDLSQRRAKAVALELVSNGVAAENVSFIGYGAQNPIATNKTAEGRAQNRRVELEIKNK